MFLLFTLIITGATPALACLSPQEIQERESLKTTEEEAVKEKAIYAMFDRLKKSVSRTWDEGNLDLFITAYTWHNRLTYDRERIRRYNENPWGGGVGLSIFDEDGDNHMLFFMAFKDSWDEIQPYGGYAYLKNWYLDSNKNFRVGAGISLGITAREQYSYIPFPLPLPIFGAGYKQFSVEAAYIPGTRNNGNVLFTWVRWTFE